MSELDERLAEARSAIAAASPSEGLWARALEHAELGVSFAELSSSDRHRPGARWVALCGAIAASLLIAVVLTTQDNEQVSITDAAAPVELSVEAEEVEIIDGDGTSLTIRAQLRPSASAGAFTIGGVVITIECAAVLPNTSPEFESRDVVLAGEVTANESDLATLDDVQVDPGALVALIIRDGGPPGQRVTLYEPALGHPDAAPARSCDELVDSVPASLDGGFFTDIVGTILIS